jgi:Flp pilus assembly protein TadD
MVSNHVYHGTELRTAAALLQGNKAAAAERACLEVLRANPHDVHAVHLLGLISSALGRPGAAVALLWRSIALAPARAGFRNNLGSVLAQHKLPEAAAEAFREAVRLDPANAVARANLGSALHDLGRLREAGAVLAQAVRLRPDNPMPRRILGTVLRKLGRPSAALVELREAARLTPADPARDQSEAVAALREAADAAGDLGRAD